MTRMNCRARGSRVVAAAVAERSAPGLATAMAASLGNMLETRLFRGGAGFVRECKSKGIAMRGLWRKTERWCVNQQTAKASRHRSHLHFSSENSISPYFRAQTCITHNVHDIGIQCVPLVQHVDIRENSYNREPQSTPKGYIRPSQSRCLHDQNATIFANQTCKDPFISVHCSQCLPYENPYPCRA
jgi:hypothetical protein